MRGQGLSEYTNILVGGCGLGMNGSSCGLGRVRSRLARIINGAKKKEKAAYFPKARCSPQSLARRLASPFFLPAASSYHEVLKVAQ
jgi:hypothetical protein